MVLLLRRLPTRARVTLAFSGAMAVLLAALGLFLHLRLAAELDATIDEGLASRSGDLVATLRQSDEPPSSADGSLLTERGESLAQILDRRGRILDATPTVRRRPLLVGSALREAARRPTRRDAAFGIEGDDARLLAVPVRVGAHPLVAVVATNLETRGDALRNLDGLLGVGAPIALLLASLAGYGAAAAALAPVERMRRRAAGIGSDEPGARLPVPPTDDEIGRLGVTLNAMLTRLEEAFARERTFVADASHELRTPLAILKAELELALRDGRDAAELKAALRSAAEETDRLVALAEDLLVIARFDQGRLPIRRSPVDVAPLVEGVVRRFAPRASGDGTRVVARVDAGLRARVDAARIEQAIGNLVDNALRHGGATVEVAATAHGDALEVHVRDDGGGFAPALLPSAFERFTRGDVARGRAGTGLGLAIVEAIAIAHDGTVGASNRPDGGADVWLSVPLR